MALTGGDKVSSAAYTKLIPVVLIAICDPDDSTRRGAIACCGSISKYAPQDLVIEFAQDLIGKVAITGVLGDVDLGSVSVHVCSGAASASAHLIGNLSSSSSIGAASGGGTNVSSLLAVIDDLIEIICIGLRKDDNDGTVKIAVQR